ncbi:MAG TPA: hypothetical protein VGH12_06945, partial [Steroidobacteraceae bacterium]
MRLKSRQRWTIPLLAAALMLAACKSSPPAYQAPQRGTYKKQPAQAAIANMQLALEYMKLGQLATGRECIERALAEDSNNPSVQLT